ncbi:MAG: ThuA domain-containing protein, partial [Planctomycetota bacterium]
MSRHSEGWEHSFLPHAEVAIKKLGKQTGLFDAVTTARSVLITAQELANYDVLVFCTSGELPLSAEQRAALLDFVRGGKGFVGIHCTVDTFYEWAEF